MDDDESGYQSFVKVAEQDGSEDFMELPREKDGTVLLSTVQAQFPSAIGLKYKSSSGGWRGIRAEENVLEAPYGGWGETVYVVTQSDALKRKSSREDGACGREKRVKSNKFLDDLIVFGLPFTVRDEDLKEYFKETCGELAFHEIKYDHHTKKSRGFGFIRFKTEAAAKEALSGYHEIQGRKLVVKISEKKTNPIKLFVGRIPRGAKHEEVKEYFTEFGDLDDVFVPAGRGFAFITYASEEEGRAALRMNHAFQGARLNVTIAEPRESERPRRDSTRDERTNYTWKPTTDRSGDRDRSNERYDKYSSSRNDRHSERNERRSDRSYDRHGGSYGTNSSYDRADDRRRTRDVPRPTLPQKDIASELKTMLFTLLSNQK